MTAPILATARSGYGGRGYRIPGRGEFVQKNGKKVWEQDVYPSVTTVLKQIAKPGIDQWIADQTAAKAVVSLAYLTAVSEEIGYGGLRFFWSKAPDLVATEVRQYWMGVRDDAADLGTNIHEYGEARIDGISPIPPLQSIEAREMADALDVWLEYHTVISHNSEFTVVNDALRFAGTADADWSIRCDHEGPCLGQAPGEFIRTLVDLKSSRYLWRENGYQLAALASCPVVMREVLEGHEGAQKAEKTERGKKIKSWWVEDARPDWERYALLHIRPDDLDTKGEVIPRFCVLEDRTEDMDLFMSGFEGALALSRSEHLLRERAKARGKETEIV